MKILLVGGGSGGSVTPLLAVAKKIKITHPKANFLFVGTKTGPEQRMVTAQEITFQSILSEKFRRYGSWKNLISPLLVIIGFFQSILLLCKFKPDLVFGAGSFVQVPVVWAAWCLHIPVLLHQQDVFPSLANKLCSFPANKITVSVENSVSDFAQSFNLFYKRSDPRVVFTGNPFSEQLAMCSKAEALKHYNFANDFPTILILGGGTGALAINSIVLKALPKMVQIAQIIHGTGLGKVLPFSHENYRQFEFINDLRFAYAAADIVVSRAGFSTITELSNLAKVSLIIPIPDSHQELNALLLAYTKSAVIVDQRKLTPEGLVRVIRQILFDRILQEQAKNNISKIMPKNSAQAIADIATKIIIEHKL